MSLRNHGKRPWKYTYVLIFFLCTIQFLTHAQTVTKVQGGSCVGDNMVFSFNYGATCSVNWIIQTGVSYTIVSSSNTQLTIRFNQPVGAPVIVITANYFSCSNGQAGGANSPGFGVNGVGSPGSIGNPNATICYGGNPAALTSTGSASGASYTYQWQQSTNGGSTWSNISGATSATYDPPTGITVTTKYRRRAVGCNTMTSNIVTVTVYPDLQPGSISGNQSGCSGMNPSTFTNTTPASGGDGNYAYQWQLSTNGGSTWNSISGATLITYNSGALGVTTQYRRRVISCGQTKYSNTVTVTVSPLATPTGLNENGVQYNAFNAVWNAVSCASSYEVMISRDNIWDGGVNDCGAYINYDMDYSFQNAWWNTSCTESLQDGERYYWRVRACNNGYCSSWATDYIDLPSAGRKRVSAPAITETSLEPGTVPRIYPNPVQSGFLRVVGLASAEPVKISYRIIDPTGLPMQTGAFQSDVGLDVSGLPGGMFILQYDVAGVKKMERVHKK